MSDEERSQLIPRENRLYGTTRNESNEHSCSNVYPSGSIISDEQLLETPVSSASQSRSSLSGWNKFGFGLGHVYNDLCAGIWFSYTLLFMQNALLMPGPAAGALMMVGQVGDALATPLVGFLADKFGTKQKWHIFGKYFFFLLLYPCALQNENDFVSYFRNGTCFRFISNDLLIVSFL